MVGEDRERQRLLQEGKNRYHTTYLLYITIEYNIYMRVVTFLRLPNHRLST